MTHSQETPDQSQKAEPLPETREPLKAYQRLSEKIQDAIEKGGLKVGDKLPPERALAETFGVSRNSVREAIRTLSEQGILKSRHGDGTYICGSDLAPLTAALLNAVDTEGKSFDHIMEFRLVIEPSIARIATARHSAEQLHQLKIIVCDQQLKLLHGENDGELDAQFHTLLAAATGNPVFVDIVSHLNELFSHNRADDVRLKRRMEEAINEHLMIIDALERKDADACSDAMARHLHAVAGKAFSGAVPGKGERMLTATAAPHPGGPSRLFAHFPLSGFLAIPFPPFFRRRSRNLPPCAMTRAFGPKVLFNANALERDG